MHLLRKVSTSVLLSALLVSTAFAGDLSTQSGVEPRVNLVSLSAQAEQVVTNDIMVVRLFAEQNSRLSQGAYDANTKALNKVLDLQNTEQGKKRLEGIKVTLASRNTNPVYDDAKGASTIVAWRDRAELTLESRDFKKLTALVDELASDLSIASITFKVSDQAKESIEAALTDKAVMKFKARAAQTVLLLSGKNYGLVDLTVGEVTPSYEPGVRPMMMMAKARGPELQASVAPGETKLSLSVSGKIQVLQR